MYTKLGAVCVLLWAAAFIAPAAARPFDNTPIKVSLNPTGIIDHEQDYESIDTTPRPAQSQTDSTPPQLPQGGLQAQLDKIKEAKNAPSTLPPPSAYNTEPVVQQAQQVKPQQQQEKPQQQQQQQEKPQQQQQKPQPQLQQPQQTGYPVQPPPQSAYVAAEQPPPEQLHLPSPSPLSVTAPNNNTSSNNNTSGSNTGNSNSKPVQLSLKLR